MKIARALTFVPSVLLIFVLAACSGAPSWLEGNWILDVDRTSEVNKKDAAATNNPALNAGVNMGVMFLPALAGSTVKITDKDIITNVRGEEKYVSYEVMTATPLEVDVKKSDGTIQHFYRDGDDIYTYVPGNEAFKFYLKRTN